MYLLVLLQVYNQHCINKYSNIDKLLLRFIPGSQEYPPMLLVQDADPQRLCDSLHSSISEVVNIRISKDLI